MNELYYRVQRQLITKLMSRQFAGEGPVGSKKIHLVIYFDYEREFGNANARASAEPGFRAILQTLDRYGIRATWNCVGLISEHYPKTLHQLVDSGQELASHTYNHVDVTRISESFLKEELLLCRSRFAKLFGAEVVGLHPPRDRLSMYLPRLLTSIDYRYMIARDNNPKHWHAHYLGTIFGSKILTIPSIADDWRYIENNYDTETMLRLWNERIAMLQPGWVAAIGFHPWVLGASPSRVKQFADFLEGLMTNDSITLSTAREISDWYEG